MAPLSSPPDSSAHERSAQRERHHTTKTHRKQTSHGGLKAHAERAAKPAEGATESHTDARVTPNHKAHTPRRSGAHDRDGKASEEAGKGFSFAKLLATPFFLLGGALSAAGGVVFGVGSMVKGMGRGGEK